MSISYRHSTAIVCPGYFAGFLGVSIPYRHSTARNISLRAARLHLCQFLIGIVQQHIFTNKMSALLACQFLIGIVQLRDLRADKVS